MNWPEFIKKTKRVSSLELEKPDITFEVWELGRTIAKIMEACWLIRPTRGEETNRNILIRKLDDSLGRLKVLYKKLSAKESNILGWTDELGQEIEKLAAKNVLPGLKPEECEARIEEIERLISCQLKAKSVHLFHIFSFGLSLRKLKIKLIYGLETETEEIENHIKQTIDLADNLRLGDKTLSSPNLEITRQNLKIIRSRLKGWLKFLPDLRKYYIEIASSPEAKARFLTRVQEKIDLWTELILDIKNPSDYLSFRQRICNTAVPIIVCYYLLVFLVLGMIEIVVPWAKTVGSKTDSLATVIVIVAPLIVPAFSIFRIIYLNIKEWRVTRSFKFKLSEFKKI